MRSRIKALTKSFNKFKKQKSVWWQVAVLACFLIVASLFLYSPGVVPVPPADAQNNTPNMLGWAWSSNVGWISVNCANTATGCNNGSWGLTLMPTANEKRDIVGYAWNEKIGWIKFNPPGPYPNGANTVAAPTYMEDPTNVDPANKRVFGWARACNVFVANCAGALKSNDDRGGWDGWISMGQSTSVPPQTGNQPYGVIANETVTGATTTLHFNHFAWGQTVLGWVNFNPRNNNTGVTCCTNRTLTIVMNGAGEGTVSKFGGANSGSVLCAKTGVAEKTCVYDVAVIGDSVGLLSSAAGGSSFNTWGDACSGVQPLCNPNPLDLSQESKRAVATFNTSGGPETYSLTLTANPNAFGEDGGNTTLTWTSQNIKNNTCAQSASPANGSWNKSGQRNASSTSGVPVTADTTFTITCEQNNGEMKTATAVVDVGGTGCTTPPCSGDPKPDVTLTTPNPTTISADTPTSVTLDWTISGGDKPLTCSAVSVDGVPGTLNSDDSGSDTDTITLADGESKTYSITCTESAADGDSDTASVTFQATGLPPCLVQSDVSIAGPTNIITFNLPGSGPAVDADWLSLAIKQTSIPSLDVDITETVEVNGLNHPYDDQTMCIMASATAPDPNNPSTCPTSGEILDILNGQTRNRRLWMFATEPGRPDENVKSVFPDLCNARNSNKGCSVRITVTPKSGQGCEPLQVHTDVFVNYQDGTITNKAVGN